MSAAAVLWLWLAAAGLGAVAHHDHRSRFPADDIGNFAGDEPVPVRLRGRIYEEPVRYRDPKPDPLLTFQKPETTVTVIEVAAIEAAEGWTPARGQVRLTVEGRLEGVHRGDAVEAVGLLSRPPPPANPGERDYQSLLLDQQITAVMRSKGTESSVTRLEEGWRGSLFGWLAAVRGWGTRVLFESLPESEAGLAAALLLGDGTAMEREQWDAFVRTGVVHVLAISGQHLVVLAGFLWLVLRAAGVRRRKGALAIALLMIAYALLTGGRPSAMRAAVMVSCLCTGIIVRRPISPANAFALAWLAVIVFNPTDPFTAGCQLSFFSVFVLIWFLGPWLRPRELTPLEELIEESRGPLERLARWVVRIVASFYVISLVLCAGNAPLILSWQNIISPTGILLGPPLILLTSIALVAGFLLLLFSALGTWAAWPFAQVTRWSLAGCEEVVRLGEAIPGGWVYAPGPETWWLVGCYAAVAGLVLLSGRWRFRSLAALVVWTLFGLAVGVHRPDPEELRVTFLAVGHGGCVVIETPDGRVLLYDTGTTLGPDTVRRTVAPFLWHRGISRIDEVFLSHADLDHFNGVPELLKRFAVGRVTVTPSFADKSSPGVEYVLAEIARHGIEVRIARTGDRFAAGELAIEVLHPPSIGPAGIENARSLVLLLHHAGHTILLTGDLEEPGQSMVVKEPIAPADVMLAPHHGAVGANGRAEPDGRYSPGPMALWARPRFVVSSQKPGPTGHLTDAYGAVGAVVWDTPTAGAVTVRSNATGIVAESFRACEVRVVRSSVVP
jgi:competence protein ComEC